MRSIGAVVKRTLVSFYDDQMTHHAAALTYYSLMSLFPATLLGLSLLGLLGQYPSTYNAIINYLRDVVPHSALVPLDSSLRQALQHKGTAVATFVISIALTLYGTTGVLEAARRALNVVFEIDGGGRSFLRRKSTDIVFTFVPHGPGAGELDHALRRRSIRLGSFRLHRSRSHRLVDLECRPLAGSPRNHHADILADLLRDARRAAAGVSLGYARGIRRSAHLADRLSWVLDLRLAGG